MKVLVIGAAGMLGRKLALELTTPAALNEPLSQLVLVDVVASPIPAEAAKKSRSVTADVSDVAIIASLIKERPDLIFHLAAVVSGEAEADFEKGYSVNFDGTRALFEAIRIEGARENYRPRLIFASSIAVFGAPFNDPIGDDFLVAPLSSYGTQKAMAELLLADYSRRGFFDGIGLRLPTICVRPGPPNKAASGFYSNILREPLAGKEAILPVPQTMRHWFASPRSAVGFFIHAARMDLRKLGTRRILNMPGVSATVAEEIAALRRKAGEHSAALIKYQPNPDILRLIESWPRSFSPDRAEEFGFKAENSIDEIIAVYMKDELGQMI